MADKKYKCPKCGSMNEKDDATLVGKRWFCNGCVDDTASETKEEPKVRQIRRFEQHEEVQVISLVKRGSLIFIDHEGIIYEWQNFNDDNWMSIKSLTHMRNRHKKFFEEPWVRVDDDVAEFLKIKVDESIDIDNIDAVFNLSPDELESKLVSASNGARSIIADTAIKKVKDGSLDSRNKIRIIEKICKVELEEKDYREFTEEVKK